MLSKEKRLNLKKDFKWVASGSKLESKYCKVFLRFGKNQMSKVGIAASAKFFKKSSQRNRARRLVSAALEQIYSKLPGNINIVVLPKQGVLDVKSSDVLLDLEGFLENKNEKSLT